MEEKIESKVTAWGIRLQVPAGMLKGINLEVNDGVIWEIEEREGKKVVILSKMEEGTKQ